MLLSNGKVTFRGGVRDMSSVVVKSDLFSVVVKSTVMDSQVAGFEPGNQWAQNDGAW